MPETNDFVTETLDELHREINSRHDATRVQLLASLPPKVDGTSRSGAYRRGRLVRLIGFSAAAVLLLALAMRGLADRPAMAMDRMGQAIGAAGSWSFRMEAVTSGDEGKSVVQSTRCDWRTEPLGMYSDTEVHQRPKGTPLVHLEETHGPAGGIMVDHLKRQCWEISETLDAASIGNPLRAIFMVRDHKSNSARFTGRKVIDGVSAVGLRIVLGDRPRSDLGEATLEDGWDWAGATLDVWLDPKTDLPLEFSFVRTADESETRHQFTDIQWDVEFATDRFQVSKPAGYADITEQINGSK